MDRLPDSKLLKLEQNLALLPLAYETRQAMDQSAMFEPFWFLPHSLAQLARELSQTGPIGYIEVDFFGGTGQQIAMLWQSGASVWGPVLSEHNYAKQDEGAINQLARLMGVHKTRYYDEFEAMGLNRFRSDEDWLETA
jgi:hypothetical protein